MYNYLTKIYQKNKKSSLKRTYKNINWAPQKERVLKVFKKLADDSTSGSFIDQLYVSENKELRQIQLHSGRHPVGLYVESSEEYGLKCNNDIKLDVETGAAIVLSQSASGEVVVILYSFSSEQRKPNIDKFVWTVLDGPNELTHDLIAKFIKDFFRLSRYSSALYTESLWDRLRITYLGFKGQYYVPNKKVVNIVLNHWAVLTVGFVGSLCSILGMFLTGGT